MSTELTNIYIKVAEYLGPVRNLLIVVFFLSLAGLVIWVRYSDSEMLIIVISLGLFWSFYLLMIETTYGQGLCIGNWIHEGREEIRASSPLLQVFSGVFLFFYGVFLTFFTIELLSASVR